MTNELLVNRFLNQQKRDGKSILTLSAYATDLRQFCAAANRKFFSSLRTNGLNELMDFTSKLSPNAAARKLTTLRLFLKWGYHRGYLNKDLSVNVFRPKRQTIKPAKSLSASQITRLRRTATIQERLLLELMLQTGMKLPQVLSLKMKHLDSISMTKYLQQALEYYLAVVTRGPRSYLVVSLKTGRPPGVRAAEMILSKLGRRAGVRGATPRNLRATFRSGTSARARIRT